MKKQISLLACALLLIFSFLPAGVKAQSTINEEIVYNIIVDRFNIGDQAKDDHVDADDPYAFHGGDLRGITDKLNDIQQLGYTAISISPIMENTFDGFHGYWIEDFYKIEEQFGTMEDLHTLIEEAHKRDIKVILEFVTNYVSDSHSFTNDEDKSDWFKQNNVSPTESTFWLDEVAVLDQENSDVAEYLLDVVDFWMNETDIDGFNLHGVDQVSPPFLEDLIEHIKAKDSSFYLLGNIVDPDASIQHLEQFTEDIVIENYDLSNDLIDVFTEEGAPVSDIYETWDEIGHKKNLLFVDNEHTKRFSQAVAETGRNTTTVWKLALTYMYTSPGTPFLLQGSDLIMYGDGFPETQRLVPFHSGEPDVEQFFERIAALKKEFPPLSYGSFEQAGTSGAMSVFERTYDDETIYIAINNDTESQTVTLSGIESEKRLRGVLEDNLALENKDGTYSINIPRESVEVYTIEENTGLNWWLIGFIAGVFLIFVSSVIYLSRKQKARNT